MNFNEILTVFFTLFAVIDILGSIPILVTLKEKIPDIHPGKVTLASCIFMVGFLFLGEYFLQYLGIDLSSFALAGSIVMFILALEMVLGIDIFRTDPETSAGSIVPVAFPIIAGSGTLTTILSLKAIYDKSTILVAILMNIAVVFIVLKATKFFERKIGKNGMMVLRKFFGVILLAIAVKLFKTNL
jgi:multiple antibiotic resistance protein